MSVINAYLAAASQAVSLLGIPEVDAAWERPSALAEMTVGGLAGHLAYQIFSVSSALEERESQQAPIPLLEHYARCLDRRTTGRGCQRWNSGEGRGHRIRRSAVVDQALPHRAR